MLNYLTVSIDSVNNGEIIEVALPDGRKKRVNLRFGVDSPSEDQKDDSINVVLNEIELAYDQGII